MSEEEIKTQDEPAQSVSPLETTYTQADLDQRLRGQGTEIDRLKQVEAEYQALKAEQEKAKLQRSVERGEFQKLFEQESAKRQEIEEQLSHASGKAKMFEDLLAREVEGQVDGIPDDALKAKVRELLKGRDVFDQRSILSTFLATIPGEAKPPEGGAPGKPNHGPPKVDPRRFQSDPEHRAALVRAALQQKE